MQIVRRIAAVLLGAVLLGAGYLKMLDPVGAGLVMNEYLKFFELSFLLPAAKYMACLLAILEQIVGIALMSGIWRRVTAVISAVLLGFFTVLTAILLILNPDLDCGCFGEIIKLTHLQTFIKNLVLCVIWTLAFVPFRSMEEARKIKYVGFGLSSAVAIAMAVWSISDIPAIDSTPYSCGARLYGAGLYNFDSPVLSFYDESGEYCDSLALKGDKVIVSIYDPDLLTPQDWDEIRQFVLSLSDTRYKAMALVASAPGYFDGDTGCPVYYSDPSTLVSFNRSNGGAVLLDDGEIVGKCARRDLKKGTADIPDLIDMNDGGYVLAYGALLAILAFLLLL